MHKSLVDDLFCACGHPQLAVFFSAAFFCLSLMISASLSFLFSRPVPLFPALSDAGALACFLAFLARANSLWFPPAGERRVRITPTGERMAFVTFDSHGTYRGKNGLCDL